MKTAILLKTNGEVEAVFTEKGQNDFTLKQLQGWVGGNIEMVGLSKSFEMVINENGKLDGLPKNELATKLWSEIFPIEEYPHNNDQLIVGDVILKEISYE